MPARWRGRCAFHRADSRHARRAFRGGHFAGGRGARLFADRHAAGRAIGTVGEDLCGDGGARRRRVCRRRLAGRGSAHPRYSLSRARARIKCSVHPRMPPESPSRLFTDCISSAMASAMRNAPVEIVNLRLRMIAAGEPCRPRARIRAWRRRRRLLRRAEIFFERDSCDAVSTAATHSCPATRSTAPR